MNSTDEGRRPGRPSNETGPATTRAELLEVAQRMIATDGFDGTSIRGLAREAGVTHGTVQHHFPTKEAMWKAVVDEVLVPRIVAATDELLAQSGNGVEAMIAARVHQDMGNRGVSGALLLDNSDGALDRLAYLARATEAVAGQTTSQIEALVAAGALRAVNPEAFVALDIALACLGSADQALQTILGIDASDSDRRTALATDITDILLYGVMPRD